MDKYEEALQKAKKDEVIYDAIRKVCNTDEPERFAGMNETVFNVAKAAVESLFPELAESEDERIRKEIREFILYKVGHLIDEDTEHRWLAYLEKQKDLDKMIVVSPEVWDKAISDAFENGEKEGEKQKEQKPAEDNPFTPLEGIDAIKAKYYDDGFKNGFDEGVDSVAPVEWSEEDEKMLDSIVKVVAGVGSQKNGEREKQMDWLKSLRPQPKVEWSEEDRLKLRLCIEALDVGQTKRHIYEHGFMPDELKSFLKSLRPSWKPSEEQMQYLAKAIHTLGEEGDCKTASVLNEIRNHIKDGTLVSYSGKTYKLKEE